MKISFVVSCYTPGKDGVGDYVRRLVGALHEQGHRCQIIAVADRYALTSDTSNIRTASDAPDIVRINWTDWCQNRLEPARAGIKAFAPDWVSLQMVCFGYAHRGLLFDAQRRLLGLVRGLVARRHMMWHEAWAGAGVGSPLRHRVLGLLQRRLLARFQQRWAALATHTSNEGYRQLLATIGVDAKILPLFGGLPVVPVHRELARNLLLDRLCLPCTGDSNRWIAGVFGSIPPEWEDVPALASIGAQVAASGHQLVMVQLGRAGPAGELVWQRVAEELTPQITFLRIGETDESSLSMYLSALDFGISTTPWIVSGKSSTNAALIERGVPVVVTRNDCQFRSIKAPECSPWLFRLDNSLVAQLGTAHLHPVPAVSVRHVALQLIRQLSL